MSKCLCENVKANVEKVWSLAGGVKEGVRNSLNKKTAENQRFKNNLVELEGVEPSSKQGSHMLSTCLSLPSVFVHKQDQSHQLMP